MRRKRNTRWEVTNYNSIPYVYDIKMWGKAPTAGSMSTHHRCRNKANAMKSAKQLKGIGGDPIVLKWFYRKGVRMLQEYRWVDE